MKRIFIKLGFLFSLFIFVFGISTKDANADWVYVYTQGSCITTGLCSKGSSSCPMCSSPANACCDIAESWTKYNVGCALGIQKDSWGNDVTIITVTVSYFSTEICSIGDKENPNSNYVMRAGNCDCSVGGPYKACCNKSTGQLVQYTTYQDDRAGTPLEARCPGGQGQDISASSNSEATSVCAGYAPVNGNCGSSNNSCTAGTLSDIADSSTQYLWNCVGSGGGTTDNCSLSKAINGVCGSSNNSCTAGNLSDIADSSTQYLWRCTGINGGTTANCSADITVNMYYCSGATCEVGVITQTSSTYTNNDAGINQCNSNLSTYHPGNYTGGCSSSPPSNCPCPTSCTPNNSGCAALTCVGSTCFDGCNNINGTKTTGCGSSGCIPWTCPSQNGQCGSNLNTCDSAPGGKSSATLSGHYYYWTCYGSR